MIGWESVLKVGKGIELIWDEKSKNILENNEIGYALRYFYKDKILFTSSSNPIFLNKNQIKCSDDFYLPNTIGHFEPKISRKIDINTLEEILQNFKKEMRASHKGFEPIKQSISFSSFYIELKNSSSAEVSLRNYSINGFILFKKGNYFINLPFVSNQDLSISFSDYLSTLAPYHFLPLPQANIKPLRFPVLLYPFTLSFIFENLMDIFLKGNLPKLVDGFVIKDLPYQEKSPNFFPVDGEGDLKSEFQIGKGKVPYDSFSAFLFKKKRTANSLRNSIYTPPEVGFHNIVLEGPEKDLNAIDLYIALTYPLKMQKYDKFFILEAEGFLYKDGKPSFFFPSIFVKFTIEDFFSSFYFTKKPLLFYSSTFSIGVPFLFFKGLSIYPFL